MLGIDGACSGDEVADGSNVGRLVKGHRGGGYSDNDDGETDEELHCVSVQRGHGRSWTQTNGHFRFFDRFTGGCDIIEIACVIPDFPLDSNKESGV
jgi:hypothetical protein